MQDQQPQNAVDVRAARRQANLARFREYLQNDETVETALKAVAATVSPQYWRDVFMNMVRAVPELLDCDSTSLVASVRTAASLGLMTDRQSGHCYILPYNDKKSGRKLAQFILGYKGIIELALRNPRVASVVARPVFAGDDFEYTYGLDETLTHRPHSANRDGRELTHAYAICRFRAATEMPPVFTVLDRSEVDAVRNRSKASASGPWVTDFAAMAQKTAVRALAKYMPLDGPARQAIADDDAATIDLDTPTGATTSANFGRALSQQMAAPRARAIAAPVVPKGQPIELPAVEEAEPEAEPEPEQDPEREALRAENAAPATFFPAEPEPAQDPAPRKRR